MIDLHTHSTESDGSLSPGDLISLAATRGIRLIALTDHDTIGGIQAAARQAGQKDLQFIPGIELEITFTTGEFHILGLGLTENIDQFSRELARMQDNRNKRNQRILQKIRDAGIPLTCAEVEADVKGDIMGRFHIAKALVNKGIAATIDEAFRLYLGKGKRFYVAKETPSLVDCIDLVKMTGGITILAHPATLHLPVRKLKEFILKCRRKGLDGIEAFHPDHTQKFSRDLEKFGINNRMIITGGSDYHGSNREDRKLGFAGGNFPIPDRLGKFFLK